MSESAATSTGILSSWLMATRLAPQSTRIEMSWMLPVAAAACSGVQPSMSLELRSAPYSRRSSAMSTELSIQHCRGGGGGREREGERGREERERGRKEERGKGERNTDIIIDYLTQLVLYA